MQPKNNLIQCLHASTHIVVLVIALLLATSSITDQLSISAVTLEYIGTKYGEAAENRIKHWQNLIRENTGKPALEQLKVVNDFFNEAQFVTDEELWGKSDYWATPVEFLIKDAGDCEDFSIAKYFTLTEMGMNVRKLRITYVKALNYNQAHMVLAYYPNPSADPLILDNLNKQIKPASQRKDLKPVYGFNADELWLSRTRNEQVKAGSPEQLGNWQELNRRIFKNQQTITRQEYEPPPAKFTRGTDEEKTSLPKRRIDPIRANFERSWLPGLSPIERHLPSDNSLCEPQTLSSWISLSSKNTLPLLCRDNFLQMLAFSIKA